MFRQYDENSVVSTLSGKIYNIVERFQIESPLLVCENAILITMRKSENRILVDEDGDGTFYIASIAKLKEQFQFVPNIMKYLEFLRKDSRIFS